MSSEAQKGILGMVELRNGKLLLGYLYNAVFEPSKMENRGVEDVICDPLLTLGEVPIILIDTPMLVVNSPQGLGILPYPGRRFYVLQGGVLGWVGEADIPRELVEVYISRTTGLVLSPMQPMPKGVPTKLS